ncbi:MAG: hypothetical protein ACP5MD_13320 [Verrucomicrobiia bacterium]
MNTVENIVRKAFELGFRLDRDGEKIVVFSVDGLPRAVPSDFVDQLRQAKPELMAYFARRPCPGWGQCPPADLPFRPAPVRLPPEQRKLIIDYVSRQLQDDGLAEWLCDRQERYYATTGRHWDCCDIMLASAVDLACWQFNRDAKQTCELLDGFRQSAVASPPQPDRRPARLEP